MHPDKSSLPISQRILTQESIHVIIVIFALFSWLNAVVVWSLMAYSTARPLPLNGLFIGLAITLALNRGI